MTDRRISDERAAELLDYARNENSTESGGMCCLDPIELIDLLADRASDIAEIAKLNEQLAVRAYKPKTCEGPFDPELAQLKQAVESATSLAAKATERVATMSRRDRTLGRSTRCIDGRLMRHDPQPDDPSLETDIGECPECDGHGCEAVARDNGQFGVGA